MTVAERWQAMTPAERQAQIQRMQSGRRRARARRPSLLAELEREAASLGAEFQCLAEGSARRLEIIRYLRDDLGPRIYKMKWSGE